MSEQINKNNLPEPTKTALNFLEPATILTLMIGAVYFLGWTYMDGYFRRVGINHLSLNLSTTYYLQQGYLAATAFLVLLNVFHLYRDESAKKDVEVKRVEAFVPNLSILIVIVLLFFPYPRVSPHSFIYFLMTIIPVLLILAISTWRKSSIFHIFSKLSWLGRFFITLFIFSLLTLHALNRGARDGKWAVEGKGSGGTSLVSFVWKDTSPTELEGKQLILIIHDQERYYVVERVDPAPDYPYVFIIPDDMLKYAITSSPH